MLLQNGAVVCTSTKHVEEGGVGGSARQCPHLAQVVRNHLRGPSALSIMRTGSAKAASMDAKVLSYGDMLLRASDVALLRGDCWLNDQACNPKLLTEMKICSSSFLSGIHDCASLNGCM